MPRLFVLGGPEAGATHDVTGRVVLGRSPECDVRLRHPSVSRQHAELVPEGDAWVVRDLDSRNGVRHGGERVQQARLADGDEFMLGELPLRLRLEVAGPGRPEARSADFHAEARSADSHAGSPRAGDRAEAQRGEELELEGEELLTATAAYEPGAGSVSEVPAASGTGHSAPPDLDERARLIFEMQRESRGGALSADLAQRPWPIRMALYLLAAGLALALAYGAYRGVLGLRR